MRSKLNLFRGLRLSDDTWVKGWYVPITDFESGEESAGIIPVDDYLYSYGELTGFEFVAPDTIGQLIGNDQVGRSVYEGDILESIVKRPGIPVARVIIKDIRECTGIIKNLDHYRVIGNIHQHPWMIPTPGKE